MRIHQYASGFRHQAVVSEIRISCMYRTCVPVISRVTVASGRCMCCVNTEQYVSGDVDQHRVELASDLFYLLHVVVQYANATQYLIIPP